MEPGKHAANIEREQRLTDNLPPVAPAAPLQPIEGTLPALSAAAKPKTLSQAELEALYPGTPPYTDPPPISRGPYRGLKPVTDERCSIRIVDEDRNSFTIEGYYHK